IYPEQPGIGGNPEDVVSFAEHVGDLGNLAGENVHGSSTFRRVDIPEPCEPGSQPDTPFGVFIQMGDFASGTPLSFQLAAGFVKTVKNAVPFAPKIARARLVDTVPV